MITLEAAHRIARKDHRCDWCGTVIGPGTQYVRSRHIGDDGPYSWKACLPCDALCPAVWHWAGQPDEGIGSDSFAEWAADEPNDEAALAYLNRVNNQQRKN